MDILRFDTQCISCILNKFLGKVPSGVSERDKLHFAKELLRIIADADDTVSAPEIVASATALKNRFFGSHDDFADVKKHFNALMLSLESDVEKRISLSDDPLQTAAKYALLGNYIDFGAMDSVDEARLGEILKGAEELSLDSTEFGSLLTDLKKAESLVYLTDNCGEVVMDKLFIREIRKRYPEIRVTAIVRGEPVLNDATVYDAEEVGLTETAEAISNGTNIAGTCVEKLSRAARAVFDNADVIISKGQGNFETLHHCQRNVYYLFLCKCRLFSDRFGVPGFTGMLLNDLRMK